MSTATMSETLAILDAMAKTESILNTLAETKATPDGSDLDYLRSAEEEWDLVADLDATGGEWDEDDVVEFEAWLDSIQPSIEECEWRDCGFGHSA